MGAVAEMHVPEAVASDSAAVAAAIRGDADAIRHVWVSHRRWVAAILLAHKPRDVEVDDLIQEVAVAFVRTIGDLRDGAALKPWLRTVAINAARAAGRKTRLRLRHPEPGAGTPAVDAPDATAGREEASRLMDLAGQLPEGYREPLLLRCVRGMSYQQIGALMGLPETTIETRIARGRRMLRELADVGPDGTARAAPGEKKRTQRAEFLGDGPLAMAGV